MIDQLAAEHRTESVVELARATYNAVPSTERHRAPVEGLREILALPAGH